MRINLKCTALHARYLSTALPRTSQIVYTHTVTRGHSTLCTRALHAKRQLYSHLSQHKHTAHRPPLRAPLLQPSGASRGLEGATEVTEVSQWLCFLIYAWTLLAPYLMRNHRDFGIDFSDFD